jgi:hypothetical protein
LLVIGGELAVDPRRYGLHGHRHFVQFLRHILDPSLPGDECTGRWDYRSMGICG